MRALGIITACLFLFVGCDLDEDPFFDAGTDADVGADGDTGADGDVPDSDVLPDSGAGTPVDTDPSLDDAEAYVLHEMDEGGLPGLAMAIVGRDGVRWSATFGLQNVDGEVPVTTETLFPVASISKLFVGLMMMREVEAGTLDLDAPASNYLTHALQNPSHPEVPITSRALASHTSSLRDGFRLFTEGASPRDSMIPLGEFTAGYVTPGGASYSESNFSAVAPGASYGYSNAGIAVLGHVVEGASGLTFREGASAFAELLGMDGDFFVADVDPAHLAVQYAYGPRGYAPLTLTEVPHYPAAGLKASVSDIATLLQVFMRDGTLVDSADELVVLSAESIAEMERVAEPGLDEWRGLTVDRRMIEGQTLRGHRGSAHGGSADAWYTDDYAIILFANADAYLRERFGLTRGGDAMRRLRAWLVRRAEELD